MKLALLCCAGVASAAALVGLVGKMDLKSAVVTEQVTRQAVIEMRRFRFDPSSPPRAEDCDLIGKQYAAYRDDGAGWWVHDCVDFRRGP